MNSIQIPLICPILSLTQSVALLLTFHETKGVLMIETPYDNPKQTLASPHLAKKP